MHTQSGKLLLASSIVLAMATMTHATAAETMPKDSTVQQKTQKPMSQEVTNARQEAQIWTTFMLSPYLRANDIQVSVQDGKATLTGKVDEEVNKDLAKQIALGVSGIKAVDNQIVVQADYVPPKRATAERSYGEVIDDATITAAVKSKLLWSKHAEGIATDVDTNSGRVTLQGTVDTQEAKAYATSLAMNTRGVVAVDNKLVVDSSKPKVIDSTKNSADKTVDSTKNSADKTMDSAKNSADKAMDSAKNSADKAEQGISDAWITTKVKSTFMYSSNVDAADISVDTKNGVVTLSGKVDSGEEQALAIALAQNIRGVKSVVAKDLMIDNSLASR